MENIQYNINGRKYVLLDLVANQINKDKLEKAIMKNSAIIQSTDIIEIGGFLFKEKMVKLKLLVPEENLMSFNAES